MTHAGKKDAAERVFEALYAPDPNLHQDPYWRAKWPTSGPITKSIVLKTIRSAISRAPSAKRRRAKKRSAKQ